MRHRFMMVLSFIATILLVVAGTSGASSASPLGRLHNADSGKGLVEKTHGRHCSTRYGFQRHWHGRYGHSHRRWHRHGRCYRVRRYYYRPYRRRYYRRYYAGPRFYYGRRYYYPRRFRRGVSVRLYF